MCVNLKYIPLTKLRHPLSYFLIFYLESCTSLRPQAQEGLEMLTAWGPDLHALQCEFRGEASAHPSQLESQRLRDQQASRCRKSRKRESQDAKVVQVQTAVPSLTRPFVYCGNNAVLAPASRILHPKSHHLSPQLAAPLRAPFLPIPRVPFPSTLRPCPTLAMRSRCSLCP